MSDLTDIERHLTHRINELKAQLAYANKTLEMAAARDDEIEHCDCGRFFYRDQGYYSEILDLWGCCRECCRDAELDAIAIARDDAEARADFINFGRR